jgi:hypothetical protein
VSVKGARIEDILTLLVSFSSGAQNDIWVQCIGTVCWVNI